jgi:hypothetical protein
VTLTKEQAQSLINGANVEITLGKRMKRTLMVGNLHELRKKQLEAEFQRKLAELEAEAASEA